MKPRAPVARVETALLAAIHSRALHGRGNGGPAGETASAGAGLPRQGLRSHGVEPGGPGGDGPASVVRVAPHDGAVCVFRDTPVVAHFSKPLDPASVGLQTFRVWDDRGPLPGHVRLSPDASVVIWEPDAPLTANAHHFVVCSGLRDARAREVAGHLSRFLTCDFMRRDISG